MKTMIEKLNPIFESVIQTTKPTHFKRFSFHLDHKNFSPGVRKEISAKNVAVHHLPIVVPLEKPALEKQPPKSQAGTERLAEPLRTEIASFASPPQNASWISFENWLLQVFHWFNPIIWFGFHRMRVDQKIAPT